VLVTRRWQCALLCVRRSDGKLLWQRVLKEGLPHEGGHESGSHASASPVVDAEHVFAFFGSLGLFCLDHDGDVFWEKDLGDIQSKHGHGEGASPALFGDTLVVNWDHEGPSFVVALDKATGEERWRVERGSGRLNSAWATPYVWRTPGGPQVVAPGASKVLAYHPDDGRVIWELYRWSAVATPTPFAAGDLLVLSGGSVSEPVRPLMAIRPTARGDLTFEGRDVGEHVAWFDPRGGAYIPTPVAYGDRLYALYDKGFLAVWDLANGERLSMQRVGGGRSSFSASPWAADGRVYALSETGETFVFAIGDEPPLFHTNELDAMTLATPALTPLGLFVRTDGELLRIVGSDAR
jgi:outer membrane protein assembly factor BamB